MKNQAINSSCGGKNTKIHVLINERPADKFTTAKKAIRDYLKHHGAFFCISDKVNSKVMSDFDAELYKQHNIVERFFQRIKNYRHIATRYDKLAPCFKNFVLLAAAVIYF